MAVERTGNVARGGLCDQADYQVRDATGTAEAGGRGVADGVGAEVRNGGVGGGSRSAAGKPRRLRVGDWVEVKSPAEILRTLSEDGELEGMPFMPEMFAFCGQKFRVYKSAHKTCDTVNPVRSRRIENAVHLETRCDGSAHGGCEAGCLVFWKEAWLRRLDGNGQGSPVETDEGPDGDEQKVWRATLGEGNDEAGPRYRCQATQLPAASGELGPYDVRQYMEDYTSGNVGAGRWLRGMIYISYQRVINLGVGVGAPLRWLYELVQRLWGGLPYPRWWGKIPVGEKTPTAHLNLREGEIVRVRSYEEILATCNADNKNRGMGFDGEMVPYCGRTFRVEKRVTRIIDEKSGRMLYMKNPCIRLSGVVCEGRYSESRLFCPREIYQYWREIWLERVEG